MFDASDDISRTEMASRETNGVTVRLFWTRSTSLVTLAVDDAANDNHFELILGEDDQALDVFHHPFAHAAARGVEFGIGLDRVGDSARCGLARVEQADFVSFISNVISIRR
jgi:hypothetical protein